ncbi:bifunctional alpha/beta hydrolase/OsmC family protein [Corallococcus terminator]|uniref:OsmC family protein n=1 Tax=Corallococcus terminator TaxID=2316733 RepID=A0A3A8IT20_9BACT|nr:bifunctional alpha/beta hydrolase/OsmC family protein [Corallococcus terminator]RKG82900.1 OsmC family protein [Corallococcus terminator]
MSPRAVSLPGGGGWLELPATAPAASAVLVSCFACVGHSPGPERLARALVTRGFAVLRLDFTQGPAVGAGERPDTVPGVDAVVAASAFLATHAQVPRLLVGHSLGGAAVVAALPRLPEVAAVALVNAPAGADDVRTLLPPAERDRAECSLALGPGRLRLTRDFLTAIEGAAVSKALGAFPGALLVLHAPEDRFVGLDSARRLVTAARRPASLVMLDGADHFLSRPEDAAYAADVLGPWAARHVAPVREREAPLPEGQVEVREAPEGGLAQDIRVGTHWLRADEPLALGGQDSGPTPYGLLAAALGACTSMTVRMYADRQGWPLTRVRVRLDHDRVHAKDCAECESRVGRVDRLERSVRLEGPLTDEQRARLLHIADLCPVHRTLESRVDVRTRRDDSSTE